MQGVGLLKMSNEILRARLSARTIHVEIMDVIRTKIYSPFLRRRDDVDVDAYFNQTG